jgi:hypothetical protein
VLNAVLRHFRGNPAPILVFYDSEAEQEILTKRFCNHFIAEMAADEDSLLWFCATGNKTHTFQLSTASLEEAFFWYLREGNISHDIGIHPFALNKAAVERVRQSVLSGSSDEMRSQFVLSLRREVAKKRTTRSVDGHQQVVIFSGFPPFSRRLYREIWDAGNVELSIIFLCSSSVKPLYELDEGAPWRQFAIPANSITNEPLTTHEDIERLGKRISISSQGRVSTSDGTEAWMTQLIGRPLSLLTSGLINKLRAKVETGSDVGSLDL